LKRRSRWAVPIILTAAVIVLLGYFISHGTVALLSPAGTIAEHERSLIIFATVLSSVVILPVFALTGWIVWRYRASNMHAAYDPHWDHNRIIESIWWLIPSILIAVLAVVEWRSSHALDPTVAIPSSQPTVNIQVVALQWKWLFIYPGQGVASVNKLMMPVNRAVHFDITADAPMNSFWIPQLGGQIYAMPGMSTQLNLEASKIGTYRGSSANISGAGFAGMDFQTHAVSQADFVNWASQLHAQRSQLSSADYDRLRQPSNGTVVEFGKVQSGLYQTVVERYMVGHSHTPLEIGT
jgi:cytochrome o ubiquinol oxidase subunit 2